MDWIAALIEKLKNHPELVANEVPGGIRIAAPGPEGFAVEVVAGDGEWTVFLGEAGFHEHFDTGEEALNFIAWCYSGEARIRETWRGRVPVGAVLESQEAGTWSVVSQTKLIFAPFWRARSEIVRRNPNLLKPA